MLQQDKVYSSSQLFSKAKEIIPGGANSPVRSFGSVGGDAFIASHGKGPYLYDLEEKQYIDLVCSWGPLIHGHCHPKVIQAVESELKKGTSFGMSCRVELELAECIESSVPSIEMLRLVNSGTEACMSAIRVARAFTKRDLIVKFEGNYHGHADSFLASAGSGLVTSGITTAPGVPEAVQSATLTLPYNDVETFRTVFEKYGERIAAVILEPVTGNVGVIRPEWNFLQELRSQTERNESLLIFDEVMTGFRLSLAGAQGLYQVRPDLSCFGKIIGGGLPIGAYGGRRDIMSLIAPLGSVYQAGTLSGNPLSCSAGLASLELIREDEKHFYQQLDARASQWKSSLEAHIDSRSYPVCIEQVGSMLTVFFRENPPRNYREAKTCDLERFGKFFWAMLDQGIFYPPSQFEACFLSGAHEDSVMDRLIESSKRALDLSFQ